MRLGDFLNAATGVCPAKHIKIKIVGEGTTKSGRVSATADATLIFVSETERGEAIRDAHKAIREQYKDGAVPEDRLEDEITFHVLYRALRDTSSDNYLVPFAESVKGLKNALVLQEAHKVWRAYREFVAAEFPDDVSNEDFEKLVKEAESKSLADLLSEFGFSPIFRALPSLAARFGK